MSLNQGVVMLLSQGDTQQAIEHQLASTREQIEQAQQVPAATHQLPSGHALGNALALGTNTPRGTF